MIIDNEPRIMMSESLRDSLEEENKPTFDSSYIGTVTFVTSEDKEFFSVLKELKLNKNGIKFSVTCRCDDAYSLFVDVESKRVTSFKKAFIEHKQQIKKIDLENYNFVSAKIYSVNNDEQTCVCNIKFKTTIKSVL